MNVQDITVDLSKKNVKPESIVLRQGDKSGTTLRVKVLDNGVNVSSLDGYVAKFIMKLPYNRFYYEVEGTISGSMLTFVIDESYAAVQSGVTNIAYVALVNGDVTRMSANNIRVEILPSALDGFTPPPEWTDPIDEFIEEQTARVDTIVENAESATTAANTAATNANDKAALANTAATNANAKAGLADEAATNANAKAQEADEAAQAADEAREAIQDDLAAKADKDGYHSLLGAGTSDALMSTDGDVDTFARRISKHDGACKIVSLRGNTVRWNQLNNNSASTNTTGLTRTYNADGSVTLNGTSTGGVIYFRSSVPLAGGHKYLVKGCPANGGTATYFLGFGGSEIDTGNGGIALIQNDIMSNLQFVVKEGVTFNNTVMWPQFFDLTVAFGAGNEPPTVAEFEARFPEAHYPYDAGSLLSVDVRGVKAVGFNQLDSENYDTYSAYLRHYDGDVYQWLYDSNSKSTVIPCLPNTTYYVHVEGTAPSILRVGSIDSQSPPSVGATGWTVRLDKAMATSSNGNVAYTTGANSRWLVLQINMTSFDETLGRTCINLSDPSRNGTYEPYVEQVRGIDTSQYFPTGMKSAGSAADELTKGAAIQRIGVVDLGTLLWAAYGTNTTDIRRMGTDGIASLVKGAPDTEVANIKCALYTAGTSNGTYVRRNGTMSVSTNGRLFIYDENYNTPTSAAAFKEAMSGVLLYYEFASPTTTEIEPSLNLTYKTERGGTESIVIPTGEMSAAPTMEIVYAYNADGVRDLSQAIIANIEGNTASTNYAIGGYFVYAGKLHRVTSAIATGETINPGTNCVQTTVMEELIALTA